MPEAVLDVRGLHAGYGKKLILRGVSFSVGHGEVVALLGANGSGKSTALNTISGFLRPSSGSIRLHGREIAGLPPHKTFRRGVVQISQARDLFPDLSVQDNLRLGAMLRRDVDASAQVQRIFEYFPRLSERREQHTRTLSGGEQQMVALGRALMSQPKILLLDEPSGGLAPQFVQEIGSILGRLKELGTTMLLVEQNIALAFELADRLIILRDGAIIEGGTIDSLGADRDEIVRTIYL